ncbi:MAG: DUF222 domain-containing protein [Actinomycetia bacterium]|nr:DUF222 domain-containing protein [Actinomycetes bacterium]
MIVTVEELDEQTKVAQGLVALGHKLSRGHYDLCVGSVQFADGAVWVAQGSASAAHWLAERLDVTASTVREWIRIGRALGAFRPSADAFANGRLSYAKIQVLTRYLTINNEPELLALAERVAAGSLPEAIDAELMRVNLKREPDGDWPTIAQQRHDALTRIIGGTGGTDGGNVDYEVIFHVRGDGCTLKTAPRSPNPPSPAYSTQPSFGCSSTTQNTNPSTPPPANDTPTANRNASSRNEIDTAPTVAARNYSPTTTTLPGKPPTTPTQTNSNSAAPPATAQGTALLE